jgi:hypothetical protein
MWLAGITFTAIYLNIVHDTYSHIQNITVVQTYIFTTIVTDIQKPLGAWFYL